MTTRVLFVGQTPEAADYGDPALPPATEEKARLKASAIGAGSSLIT
jgi:hypothetical protein